MGIEWRKLPLLRLFYPSNLFKFDDVYEGKKNSLVRGFMMEEYLVIILGKFFLISL